MNPKELWTLEVLRETCVWESPAWSCSGRGVRTRTGRTTDTHGCEHVQVRAWVSGLASAGAVRREGVVYGRDRGNGVRAHCKGCVGLV